MPCLIYELRQRGLTVQSEKHVPMVYKELRFDCAYRLDLLVNGQVVVEVKSVDAIAPIHEAQMLTYLRLTECAVGLILNFNVTLLRDGGIHRVLNKAPQRREH